MSRLSWNRRPLHRSRFRSSYRPDRPWLSRPSRAPSPPSHLTERPSMDQQAQPRLEQQAREESPRAQPVLAPSWERPEAQLEERLRELAPAPSIHKEPMQPSRSTNTVFFVPRISFLSPCYLFQITCF